MPKNPKHPLDKALEQLRDQLSGEPSSKSKKGEKKDNIVSRRDERGIPYPVDFPNPASDRTRGCF